MKRFLIAIFALILAITLIGCKYIGNEKAVDAALADLGTTRVNVASFSATLDKERDPVCYVVTLNLNDRLAIYNIDAKTGNIISSEIVAR